jgi:hypothetical protein
LRTEAEIREKLAMLESEVQACRANRYSPGRSEGMRDSDAISACIAAAMISTLAYVLGEQESPMQRSDRLKWIRE